MYFVKSHGIGNDFVILEGVEGFDLRELSRFLCDRHFGIGSDGILVYGPSEIGDFKMRIFNPDGSEAEMCGNGIRCITQYAYKKSPKRFYKVETKAGVLDCEVTLTDPFMVKVNMGRPRDIKRHQLNLSGEYLDLTLVSMGNPHAVRFTDDVSSVCTKELGPRIENHPDFPERTNVEFVEVKDKTHLLVKVWERGAGETLACGTGACASVVASITNGFTENLVEVTLPGGRLNIEWRGDFIFMEGPTEEIFRGEMDNDYLETKLRR
ncbi:MAG: diaminopimelate epimerase [bacterium]